MAVIDGIILLVVIGAIFYGVVLLASYFSPSSRQARLDSRNHARMLVESRHREQIATAALRKIARDISGQPTFDAQAALDEIEATYIKELN